MKTIGFQRMSLLSIASASLILLIWIDASSGHDLGPMGMPTTPAEWGVLFMLALQLFVGFDIIYSLHPANRL